MAKPKKPGGIVKSKTLANGTVVDYGYNPNAKKGASRKLPVPPAAKKKAAPTQHPKTGMAGLYGGVGPVAYVNNLYAPQEAQLASQQQARQAALKAMVGQFLDSLNNVSSQLAPYEAAASQQNSDAANAAASLRAANPNAVTQSDLAAIGAPQAQRDQVTAQNNTAFGGNAALLQYAGGAVPADVFRQDAAGRASYLNALPAIAASYGTRGANQLAYLASQENMKLAGEKTNALQQARSDLAGYVQGNQKLKLDALTAAAKASAAAAKASAPSASLSRAVGYLVDSTGNPVLRGGKLAVLPGYHVGANGVVTKNVTARGGSGSSGGSARYAISSTLSGQTGFWTDSHGNVVIGTNGKPIPWKGNVKAPAKPTPGQLAKWNGSLQKGYDSRPAGTTYNAFLTESVSQGVPLGAAIAFANKKWPLTQRATPGQIAQIAGATPQDVNASGANALVQAHNQTVGNTAPQSYALTRLGQYGWNNAAQANALNQLWTRESGWNPNAVNPSSGAYGIPQSLGHGHPYNLGDYKAQIEWGLNYIKNRYGSPVAAWAHETKFGWY